MLLRKRPQVLPLVRFWFLFAGLAIRTRAPVDSGKTFRLCVLEHMSVDASEEDGNISCSDNLLSNELYFHTLFPISPRRRRPATDLYGCRP